MRSFIRAGNLLGLTLLALMACTPAPPDTSIPDQGFDYMDQLPLQVATLELQQQMQPPPKRGRRVDTLTNPALATMIERWTKARLNAAGDTGGAVLTITRADIVETRPHLSIPHLSSKGEQGPSDLYAGTIEGQIRLTRNRADGTSQHSRITATATRRLSLPATATLSERELAWTGLSQRLIADFDAEIERRLGEEGWIKGINLSIPPDTANPYYQQQGVDGAEILDR